MDSIQSLPIKHKMPRATPAVDPLLAAREVADQCGPVSLMTLWRWGKDPKVGFPAPDVRINTRNYWYASTIRRFHAKRAAGKK